MKKSVTKTSNLDAKRSDEKEFKGDFTYLHMNKRYQRFFGTIRFLCAISLFLSTFIGELLSGQPISISGLDAISIWVGIVLAIVGYNGMIAKW